MERRDGDKARSSGKGVFNAIESVNSEIFDSLKGHDVRDRRGIDSIMIALDGTDNKVRLGANAILGVSLAVSRLAAQLSHTPLYRYLGGDRVVGTSAQQLSRVLMSNKLGLALLCRQSKDIH